MQKNYLVYKLLLLFSITTLFQDFTYFESVNKILFGITMLAFLMHWCKAKLHVSFVLLLLLTVVNYLFAISFTNGIAYNINDYFYFAFWVIYLLTVLWDKDNFLSFFSDRRRYVMNIVNAWTLIVGISILLPSSYKIGWGGGRYFSSFTDSVFRLAPTALMIISIMALYMQKERSIRWLFYTVIPLFCVTTGGSRTYFAIGALSALVVWYYYLRNPKRFYMSLVPMLLIFIALIMFSPMSTKIEATTYKKGDYFDFLGKVTNGRSIFWRDDLLAFQNLTLLKKAFGNGFNYVYDINLLSVGSRIWAHNDIINIALNFGVVGIAVYLFPLVQLWRQANNKIPFIKLLVFCIWFINAMFNMNYTYFCSTIALGIIVLCILNQNNKKEPICIQD